MLGAVALGAREPGFGGLYTGTQGTSIMKGSISASAVNGSEFITLVTTAAPSTLANEIRALGFANDGGAALFNLEVSSAGIWRLQIRNNASVALNLAGGSAAVGRADTIVGRVSGYGGEAAVFTPSGKATGTCPSGPIGINTISVGFLDRNSGNIIEQGWEGWLGDQFVFDKALTDRECFEIQADPACLWRPPRIWVPASAGGGGGANLDSTAGTFTASGIAALTTAATLASSAALAASGAGALGVRAALASAGAVAAATGLGALTVGGAGAALASSAGLLRAVAVGELTTQAALAGAGQVAAVGTGTLTTGGSGAALGSTAGQLQASAVGALTVQAVLAGAGTAAAAGTGTLSTGSSGAALVSSGVALSASGTGSLATRAALAATLAIAQASATAALTVRAVLAGAGVAHLQGGGALSPDGTVLAVFTANSRARVGSSPFAAVARDSVITTTAARRIGGRSL